MPAGDSDNVCRAADWDKHENDGLMRITARSLEELEGRCDITSVKGVQNSDNRTIDVNAACAGEGMTARSRQIWHTQTVLGRKMLVLVRVSTTDSRDDSGKRVASDDKSEEWAVMTYVRCEQPEMKDNAFRPAPR